MLLVSMLEDAGLVARPRRQTAARTVAPESSAAPAMPFDAPSCAPLSGPDGPF
jgi:hypothetical protein